MDKSLTHLRQQIEAASRREEVETNRLRPILTGAEGFIRTLDVQLRAVELLEAKLVELEQSGANYQAQLDQLAENRHVMQLFKQFARDIVQFSTGPDTPYLDDRTITRIWSRGIFPMIDAEQARRIRAARIQGPMVDVKRVSIGKVNGMVGEALLRIVRYLTKVTADEYSGLGGLWRWVEREGNNCDVWLYHHHPTDKWKCLFFRITVKRTVDRLEFSMESYVPFGFGKDPAQYQVAVSNVFIRPNWQTTEVGSMTYNTSNTYSLQRTVSVTAGKSIGANVNFSEGITYTDGTSWTRGESHGTSRSMNDTSSWFNNWNDSYGSSHGGGGGSFSSNSSRGGGGGGSFGTSWGDNDSYNESETRNESTAVNFNKSVGEQIGENYSETVAEGSGFARAEGEALQVQTWAYGIDFGQSVKTHMEQWRHGNPDAAEIYDLVHSTFQAICDDVGEQLTNMTKGAGSAEDGDIETVLEEIRLQMLVEEKPRAETKPRRPALLPLPELKKLGDS